MRAQIQSKEGLTRDITVRLYDSGGTDESIRTMCKRVQEAVGDIPFSSWVDDIITIILGDEK